MKTCGVCGKEKPLSEFHKKTRSNDTRFLCAECENKRGREYHERHKEKRKAQMREWRAANREKWLSIKSEYNKQHRAELSAAQRERYAQNPEEYRRKASENKKKNRAFHTLIQTLREHRKRANGGTFSANEWIALCEKYDNRCLCCNEQKKLTIDHVIPITKGGRNTIDNIQPLCQRCNSKKHDKIIDYRQQFDTRTDGF